MGSTWVILSLVSAFSLASSDALTKKALSLSNEYLVAWFRLLFSLPLLILLFFLFVPIPHLDAIFFIAFSLALPLEILTLILYMKALRMSPLSLTLPFLSLTPVFLIIVSYILLGEQVSFKGGAGIIFIAAGSYTLHFHKMRTGILNPITAITRERGSVLIIFVAFIYSFTSSLGKMAIEHSSSLFFGSTYFIMLTILFAPIALLMGKNELKSFLSQKQYKNLTLPGIFFSIMIVSHMIAISLTKVAYMISLKRTSLIIGVLYGYLFFKEKNIRERLSGAILMFIGFVLIVTAS